MKHLLLPILLLTAIYCQAAPILPEETKNHLGEDVSVRGLVEQVGFSQKGHAFLNFGGHYPNQIFTRAGTERRHYGRGRVPAIAGW